MKMVSINKNFNASQTGATFFNSSTDEDGRLVSQGMAGHHIFTPLPTIPFSSIHLAVSTLISVVGIVLAIKHADEEHRCRAYYIMIYLHILFWFLTLIIDYILKKVHHELRINGYLEFYQSTYTLHRLPVYVVSLWNSFLLIVQTLSLHYFPDGFFDSCIKSGIASPIVYVTVIVIVENVVLSYVHGRYIYRVHSFNSSKQKPDVQRDPIGNPPAPIVQTLTQTADLLARQADLIRHLREHNEKLSNKLTQTSKDLRALQTQKAPEVQPEV